MIKSVLKILTFLAFSLYALNCEPRKSKIQADCVAYSFPLSSNDKRVIFSLPESFRQNHNCWQDVGRSFCFLQSGSEYRFIFPYREERPFSLSISEALNAYVKANGQENYGCSQRRIEPEVSFNSWRGGFGYYNCQDTIHNCVFLGVDNSGELLILVQAVSSEKSSEELKAVLNQVLRNMSVEDL